MSIVRLGAGVALIIAGGTTANSPGEIRRGEGVLLVGSDIVEACGGTMGCSSRRIVDGSESNRSQVGVVACVHCGDSMCTILNCVLDLLNIISTRYSVEISYNSKRSI